MRSVTPLPEALDGTTIQRLIEIDTALIPYVSGALAWLCDKEPFEETGTLTVDDAKLLFSDMLQTYFEEFFVYKPDVGDIKIQGSLAVATGWVACEGGAISRTTYAALFAKIGTSFGVGDGSTTFNVPDFNNNSPMGRGGLVALGAMAGASTHTLTTPEIPAHSHNITLRGSLGAGSVARSGSNDGTTASFATANAGGGGAHNNLHPVLGVYFAIYHGVL